MIWLLVKFVVLLNIFCGVFLFIEMKIEVYRDVLVVMVGF